MTSYEIVRRAIEFDHPERIPLRFASLGIDDTFGIGLAAAAGWKPSQPHEDEWGVVWTPAPEGITNMGQPLGHNLTSWELFDEIPWPDPHDESRYAHIEAQLERAGDKYVVIGCGFTFLERMHYLRGMIDLFIDFYENPDEVHKLAERVVAFPIGVAEEVGKRFRGRIHGMGMTDDWGTQQAAYTNLPLFRKFFKAHYRRLYGAIHGAGMHAWMHSCGHVNDIVGEWIDCGLDVVNLQQPCNLGIEEMGRRYRGRICFESLCDIQMTLPWKDAEAIRSEARQLLDHWATPAGGFVLSDYGDGAAIGVPIEKKRVMLEAFLAMAAPGVAIPV
ncbi:MAG: hypothetical protein IT210_09345 [Armatimonadetes bacterium]|nr:hypothetical protein [Armatimonadota bacterium]